MKSTVLVICLAAAVGGLATTKSKSDEQRKDAPPSRPDATDKLIGKEAGQVRDDNGLKMKFVWCPPGYFKMEYVEVVPEPSAKKEDSVEDKLSDDDVVVDDVVADVHPTNSPARRRKKKLTAVNVVLTQGYWLGKYEVTQSEWKRVMQTEPWKGQVLTKDGDDFPATYISWDDAMAFCRKLTEQERKVGRLPADWEYTLPAEAQWERACRARTETRFSYGDDESKLGDYAWFEENAYNAGEQYAHRVGQKKANPWGLCDTYGNVWEWCRDLYTEKLPGGRDPEVKSDEKTKGSCRVGRGGSWFLDAAHCWSGYRDGDQPDMGDYYIGFRVALSGVQPVK